MTNKAVLLLKIKAEEKFQTFELFEGKKFLIGRAPSCQLALKAPNISSEHLELYFSEGQLRIRDLNSANGTFRSPARAPFVEAYFPVKSGSLELLVAKTPIFISWEDPREGPNTHIEKTIPLSELKTKTEALPAEPKAEKLKIEAKPQKKQTHLSQNKEQAGKAVQENYSASVSLQASQSVQFSSVLVGWVPSFVALMGLWVVVLLCKESFFGGLNSLTPVELYQGAAWDQFVLWTFALHKNAWIFVGLVPLLFFGTSILLKKKDLLKTPKNSQLRKFLITIILSVGVVLFPWLRLIPKGIALPLWLPLVHLSQRLEDPAVTLKAKHSELKGVLPRYRGSSYFYVKRFQVQTQRVIEECEGAGEKAWENKKVCLVLLHAVGVENFEDFAPVFLKDVALRTSLILSLDGISRVLGVEGKDSKTLSYFLNSLSLVGLESEKQQIYTILFEKELSIPETISVLQELRQSLEDRVQERYNELKVPSFLRIKILSSIELGI